MDDFKFYEERKEIEDYQEKYLIKPIRDIISSYAFEKKIIGSCEYVFENLFLSPINNPSIREYNYITVCNNKIYRLKKTNILPKNYCKFELCIYCSKTNQLVYKRKLQNIDQDFPKDKHNNKILRMIVKSSTNEIFVPDPVSGYIYKFDITTGILIRKIQIFSLSYRNFNKISDIKLSNDECYLIVASLDLREIYICDSKNGKNGELIYLPGYYSFINQLEIYKDTIYVYGCGGICTVNILNKKIVNKFSISNEDDINIGIFEKELYVTSKKYKTFFVFDLDGNFLHEMSLKFENHKTCSKYINTKKYDFGDLMIVAMENDKMYVLENNANLLIFH